MRLSKFSLLVSFALFIMTLLFSSEYLSAQQIIGGRVVKKGMWKGCQIEYADRQIAVKIKSGVKLQEINTLVSQQNGSLMKDFDKLRWGLIELPDSVDIFPVLNTLQNNPLIESVEPNGVTHISFDPNDPYFQDGHQWALKNIGQNPPSGTSDADIDAPEAWNITQGNSDIIIAILDTGIPMLNGSLSHPDLDDADKIILGEDETGDGEGVRDLYGHGTHVSGIASAEANNSTGIAGVAGGCKIMAVQVFDIYGGYWSWFKDGVIYAVDNGAKVINYSGGGGYPVMFGSFGTTQATCE
jgi:subtilisin family serine protease